MNHTHELPNEETENWTVEYTIQPEQPEIVPEQPGYPAELEVLSIKNEQGQEINPESISIEERQQIEEECWKDSKVEY